MMKSEIKKMLYETAVLGATFGTVAPTVFNSVANASVKKHHHAKKHAKKHVKKVSRRYTSIQSLHNIDDQDSLPMATTLLDGAQVYSKPFGVKGARHVFTSYEANRNYMAYQKAVLRNGRVYLKVVSWDKQVRGFVLADETTQINTYSVNTNVNNNPVQLAHPGYETLTVDPQGSTFKNPKVAATKMATATMGHDSFGIVATSNVDGRDFVKVVNLNNPQVSGWIAKSAVQSIVKAGSAADNNRTFDTDNDIRVNFVNNGNVVSSQVVDTNAIDSGSDRFNNPMGNDRILKDSFVKSLFSTDGTTLKTGKETINPNTSLNHSGYELTSADLSYSLQSLSNVRTGDTININVSQLPATDNKTSQIKFAAITPNQLGQFDPSTVETIDGNTVNFPALSDSEATDYNNSFTGNGNTFFNFKAFDGSLFKSDGKLASFDGDKQNVSVLNEAQYSNGRDGVLAFKTYKDARLAAERGHGNVGDPVNKDVVTTVKIGGQYHYAYVFDKTNTLRENPAASLYGKVITAVYDKVPVATSPANNSNNAGFTGYFAN